MLCKSCLKESFVFTWTIFTCKIICIWMKPEGNDYFVWQHFYLSLLSYSQTALVAEVIKSGQTIFDKTQSFYSERNLLELAWSNARESEIRTSWNSMIYPFCDSPLSQFTWSFWLVNCISVCITFITNSFPNRWAALLLPLQGDFLLSFQEEA